MPSTIGVTEDKEVAMDTDDASITKSSRKYHIDTVHLKVPRKDMEMTTFLKDGMSKLHLYNTQKNSVMLCFCLTPKYIQSPHSV